jgi:GTPase SAR1 family protein
VRLYLYNMYINVCWSVCACLSVCAWADYGRVDGTQCPMVIVGNKSDLQDQREVSTSDGQDLATKSHAGFIETRCGAVLQGPLSCLLVMVVYVYVRPGVLIRASCRVLTAGAHGPWGH